MNRSLQKERNTISWIWTTIRPYRGMVILLCCLTVLRTVVALINVVLLRNLIDAASAGDQAGLIHSAVLLVVISLSQVGFTQAERYVRESSSHRIERWMQCRLYRTLLNKDYVQVSSKHSAEWMNCLSTDITLVGQSVSRALPGLIGAVVHFIGACILLVRVSPLLLALAVVGGTGLVLFNFLFKEPLKQRQRELRNATGKKNAYQMEHISHLLIVKAFHREPVIADNADEKAEDVLQKKLDKLRLTLAKSGLQDIITMAGQLIVLLYCAVRILQGRISYGSCVMLLRLTSQIVTPFTTISNHVSSFFDVIVAVERLRELESYEDDPAGHVLSDQQIRRFYDESFRDIRFTDVTFAYHDREAKSGGSLPTVFSHVDLTIPKQCCMAFTGITGSGKSTFFKLLMSFYTLQAGTITVRSLDGQEQALDNSFRRLFAYVPQGNQLMAGTIRDMVTFGSHDLAEGDEAVWKALETACAKEFVEQLPQSLDTVIREKGVGLSEGQLQRIAVARALYSRRPILLLDEATSALDEATERELLTHLKQMTDLTILFATHRSSGLGICDREVHIDGDRVLLRTPRQDT